MKILETLLKELFVRARKSKTYTEFRKHAKFTVHDFFKELAEELFTFLEASEADE